MTNSSKKTHRPKIIAAIALIPVAILFGLETFLQISERPFNAVVSIFSGDGRPSAWFKEEKNQIIPAYQHQKVGQFPIEPKGPRIAVLGGSVVHGGSINMTADHEYPALLKVDAKVYNLANPSLDSHDQLSILKALSSYKMDAWVVSTGHNDFGNTYLHQRYTYWPSGILGPIGRLKERFKLTHLIRQSLGAPTVNSATPDPSRQFSAPKVTSDQKSWALLHYKMNVDAMVRLAKREKTPLILVTPPRSLSRAPIGACSNNESCANDLWNKGIEEKDIALLSEASDADTIPFRILSKAQTHLMSKDDSKHVWVVDTEALLPQDSDNLGPDGALFQDHVHYKMKGHQAMAEIVSPVVNQALKP